MELASCSCCRQPILLSSIYGRWLSAKLSYLFLFAENGMMNNTQTARVQLVTLFLVVGRKMLSRPFCLRQLLIDYIDFQHRNVTLSQWSARAHPRRPRPWLGRLPVSESSGREKANWTH